MRRVVSALLLFFTVIEISPTATAQTVSAGSAAGRAPNVEFNMMT